MKLVAPSAYLIGADKFRTLPGMAAYQAVGDRMRPALFRNGMCRIGLFRGALLTR